MTDRLGLVKGPEISTTDLTGLPCKTLLQKKI